MSRDRAPEASLADMLSAAESALSHVAGKTRDDYENQKLLRDAVERNIEIIGEAARRLTDEFRAAHPEISWRVIMATRHIQAHEYDGVDNDIVWRILTDHLPPLIQQLRAMLPPPPKAGE